MRNCEYLRVWGEEKKVRNYFLKIKEIVMKIFNKKLIYFILSKFKKFFLNRYIKYFLLLTFLFIGVVYYMQPVNRLNITAELTMLGDLNDDNKWDDNDWKILSNFMEKPFNFSSKDALKIDVNKNNIIDSEDIIFLEWLYKYSDPYIAEENFLKENKIYPKPREFFKYIPSTEYIQRPLFLLDHSIVEVSPFKDFLIEIKNNKSFYEDQILSEIYNEAIRFSISYNFRKDWFNDIEKEYAQMKISYCRNLYKNKDYYNLLLNLIWMVEDIETLTTKNQSKFIQRTLIVRDHLRELLKSTLFTKYENGDVTYSEIIKEIEKILEKDLWLSINLEELEAPRDLSKIENFIDRAEWQYYKSSTTNNDFRKLLLYAQYDRRYLRTVSKTTPTHSDIELKNHNLPMILLFREALKIKKGDKKAAVWMLDESIRIPFAWVKSIPREKLPTSIAFENFLLPWNKEDGSDKSRHWNVFWGISIYKSPQESFELALKREFMDFRDYEYTTDAMKEFIRDMIANLNWIYYIMSIDPKLFWKEDL